MTSASSHPKLTAAEMGYRLEFGESAQALLGELVSAAKSDTIFSADLPELVLPPLRVLFEAGARIATIEPGCAWEVFCGRPGLLRELIASELFTQMLACRDEIPLHIMARHTPAWLCIALSLPINEQVFTQSLTGVEAQGRSASHWLWAPTGVLDQHAGRARDAHVRALENGDWGSYQSLFSLWMGTSRVLWETQVLMQKYGVSLDQPDHQGKTARDILHARIDAGDVPLFDDLEICNHVSAHRQCVDMTSATPRPGRSAPSARF